MDAKTVTDEQHKKIQERELEWWANTGVDPRACWWYYDRVFLPYLSRDMGTVADIGCGPVPYLCNHNVLYSMAYAVDPLVDRYADLAKFDCYRSRRRYMTLLNTGEIGDKILDSAFLLNTLDHVIEPAALLKEVARILKPHGNLFLYVDIEKRPDAMHPHTITREWIQSELEVYFYKELLRIDQSWKFDNLILFYVGRRRSGG